MGEFCVSDACRYRRMWHKLVTGTGQRLREPKLVLFRNSVQSACGFAQLATGPFYCPGDEKVYLDLDFHEILQIKLGADGNFAVAYIIAYEVGHYMKKLTGTREILNDARMRGNNQKSVSQLTVRLKLQADLQAGFWIHHAQQMFNIMGSATLKKR